MKDILKLRDNYEGKKFREWLEIEDFDSKRIYVQLLRSRKNLSPYSWQSLLRWFIPTVVGIINTPAGVAVSAVDNFVVSRLMGDWHPNLFLDERLSKKLNEIVTNDRIEINHKRQLATWGKTISRNEPCPCRSGQKFKNCCGKGLF
jgi:hypothetical protein